MQIGHKPKENFLTHSRIFLMELSLNQVKSGKAKFGRRNKINYNTMQDKMWESHSRTDLGIKLSGHLNGSSVEVTQSEHVIAHER